MILAVKPQMLTAIIGALQRAESILHSVVSLLAGVRLSTFNNQSIQSNNQMTERRGDLVCFDK